MLFRKRLTSPECTDQGFIPQIADPASAVFENAARKPRIIPYRKLGTPWNERRSMMLDRNTGTRTFQAILLRSDRMFYHGNIKYEQVRPSLVTITMSHDDIKTSAVVSILASRHLAGETTAICYPH